MASSFLVLDIETVLDPELPISQSTEAERLPAPPHHKIVVIGALLFDQTYQVRRIAVLAEGKGHVMGGRFTVADINVAEVIRYAKPATQLFDANPNVKAWLDACQARPAFQAMWQARDAEAA